VNGSEIYDEFSLMMGGHLNRQLEGSKWLKTQLQSKKVVSSDVWARLKTLIVNFPIPYDLLRFKVSKGEGLGNANTFELKKWFEELKEVLEE